jgi:hypothetical protein
MIPLALCTASSRRTHQDVVLHRDAALRRLQEADAVLRVAAGLLQATHLILELLAQEHAGGVVARAVDAQSARQPLHRAVEQPLGGPQVALRGQRRQVGIDRRHCRYLSLAWIRHGFLPWVVIMRPAPVTGVAGHRTYLRSG